MDKKCAVFGCDNTSGQIITILIKQSIISQSSGLYSHPLFCFGLYSGNFENLNAYFKMCPAATCQQRALYNRSQTIFFMFKTNNTEMGSTSRSSTSSNVGSGSNPTVVARETFQVLLELNQELVRVLIYKDHLFPLLDLIIAVRIKVIYLHNTTMNSFLILFVDQEQKLDHVFQLILLAGIGIFLLGTNLTDFLHQLLPYTVFLLSVMGAVILPTMFLVLKKNPITWFIFDFVFLNTTRVLLIGYWLACTIFALLIVSYFGSANFSIKLTILRKYFHGVVIAIYLPGIFFDVELLFAASVIVFSAFLLLESVRLYDLECVGNILNKNMMGFLDEKDQGTLILTHIYLLVGCSLPIWIFPLSTTTNARDNLLLCSGIVSLGVGDTAASIGGTLWGKTKFPGSSKSVEGTLCSMLAEICFMLILFYSGMFGVSSRLPWFSFLVSSVVTSLVEARTTQVDNLVLPLVMYIILIV
nr:EOG090X0BFL [Ceriodaphnia reticulata]